MGVVVEAARCLDATTAINTSHQEDTVRMARKQTPEAAVDPQVEPAALATKRRRWSLKLPWCGIASGGVARHHGEQGEADLSRRWPRWCGNVGETFEEVLHRRVTLFNSGPLVIG